MSDQHGSSLPAALREQTLAHFEKHRLAWQSNEALRESYRDWYGRLRRALPADGPWIELGSGPGFARHFIPELILTDVVQAPWHDRCLSADALPFGDGSVGALVLFDVLHHLAAPATFFAEAVRVLRPGGRVLLCEPFISPLSRVVYGLFHDEPVDMKAPPWPEPSPADAHKDPFAANQGIPTLIFCRDGGRGFTERFPQLSLLRIERFAGLAYPSTGGFSRRPLLPPSLWKPLHRLEAVLPEKLFSLIGFRMMVVIERRPTVSP